MFRDRSCVMQCALLAHVVCGDKSARALDDLVVGIVAKSTAKSDAA